MDEPFFPVTGKQVVPLSMLSADSDATVVHPGHTVSHQKTVQASDNSMGWLVLRLGLLVISWLLLYFFGRWLSALSSSERAGKKRECVPLLVGPSPSIECSLTLKTGRWSDTRIRIRRSQEIWIEYSEGSQLSPWAVKTAAADIGDPRVSRIISNRFNYGRDHRPLESDYLLGHLAQDTLKMALYWTTDPPITVNVIVRDKEKNDARKTY